ncbi:MULTISPECIES: DUF2905 domain-containing protein [Rossellomorea]|uniref:DUF2905 domain-containing protein n=1 Tax=Rossellomorea marisflavi TaxID=189381 RepID=A0A0J5WDS0_9BACI|nr:DUF2905 domain-containing protein [Rossellomorea marisflavi]KQU59457.1 hypothetical protein ASG66_06955 [Bacillus sp. Leaf406]MBV6683960.1 DUF2905 domain-containing protein [Bacillus sp. JRC01]VXB86550.1 conserved membrane hypothetical protein [Bacillus sp. 349Y]KMK93935.1 hypothetical protein VL03_13950 [Rossellomorea marisflavi]KML07285.1 hypothetical protein VL06_05120 [Rossellomorea marisflavi]
MSGLPKLLMIAGAVLLVAGLLLQFTKLGKLPGDIVVKKENATFYFPLMTSVLLSVILSLVFYFIGRFK